MKIKLAIFFYLFILLEASKISNIKCKCEQLLSKSDCQNQQQYCFWEQDKCITNSDSPDVVQQNITYCSTFPDTICQNTLGCAWVNKECQQFAGCTAYYYSKSTQCQQVSQNCFSDGTHCIEIGNCSDYKTEVACFKNQKNLLCFWNEGKCQDFTNCNQLPTTFKSDSECREQLLFCTVAEQGGCLESAENCDGHKLESQCHWNKSKQQSCVWQDNKCVHRQCSIAPLTLTTDIQCNAFMVNCTTKENGGCTERTFCQKTTFEAACVINQFREPCIWIDNVCYDQICSKAPNSFTTNEKCKMIKKNCITTQNGCIEQLSCLSANNQIGCIDMEDGTKCFWNGLKCLQKTCSNNTTATSQAECETFSSECTFNVSASIGCVDKICENIVQQDQCTQDSFENKCAWKGNCFIKSCVFAPKSLQSHNECENYLIGCTLDSTGYGCTDKVLSCQRYTSQNSCYKTLSGEFCFWKNSQCVDRLCNMADSSITTAAGCQQFKSTCILNNNQIGCMYLTPNCNERLLHENCEYGSQPICIWNNDKCVEQSCDTANIVGSPNYLIVFTQSNCNQYMTNCVLNNSSNGCIAKPKTCSELGINNCFVSIQNDCIWTGAQCKEKICSNLIGSNHYHCYNQFSKCTVNSDLNGCIDIKKCYQYTLFEQCKINQIGDQCIWTGTQCRDSKCNDSTDTSDFDANEKCNQLNSQCTVLGKVNQQGCVIKQNICLEYKYEYQCQSTINQVQCIWMQDQCLELQTIKCENIKLILYNDNNCSSVQFRCKVNNLSSGCIDKICTDYPYSTKDACENIKGCTINRDENNCIEKKDLCSDYSSDLSQCKYSKEGKCVIKGNLCIYSLVNCTSLPTPIIYTDCSDKRDFCVMSIQGTTKSCVPGLCTSFVGSTFSFEICQQYDQSCTVNTSGTGCIQMANTCATATSVNCNYSKNDHNCIWNNSVCKPIATASENNCELITDYSGNLTFQKCQELSNNYCSVNRQKNACVKLEADCYEYADLNNCFQSSQGRCIQHIQEELITPCTEMQNSIECKNIYLGESFTYTHQICEQLKSTCTNDSTIGCKDKTCSNVDTLKTNHEECELWLSTCTINSTHDACVSKTLTCQEQTVLSCLWSQEGQCIALNNQCVKISCHLLPNSFTTHTQCENAFNKCTIANIGGCTTKSQNCKNYLTQIQCKFNFNNQKCWWNQTTMNCVNLKCEEIEKTNNYSSHNQCYNASDSIKCTVAATGLGCQQLKQCDSYTTQPSCVIDNSNQICVWNTNTLKCQYKQCNVAPLSLNSHDQCQNFYSICTVLVKLNNQQQEIVQGCQSLSSRCNDYKFEQQCYITKANQKCAWFESACTNLSCNTAPKTPNYSTHENCQNYLQTCTVSSDLLGCIPIPSKCTEISIEISCIKDASGNYCFWQDSSCQIKTCSNAPPDINTAQLCSLWLPTCTAENTNKCKRLSCEEYEFKTDSECNAAMSKCTTDGRKCVTRGSCQTLSEAGCIKSNKDEQCYWLGTKCTLKECQVINKEKDCNLDYQNTKCIWDKGLCRNIGECSDYSGTNHTDCQKFNVQCTIGVNNKCMKIKNCNQFTTQQSCILGIDGPCKWVDKLSKCYYYTSCNSIQFKSDQECKQVSPLCTSDGQSCIAITICAETNTTHGCVSGIDGNCIKTVPALNSSQPPICKLFTSCSDAYYLTHQDCQNANSSCTTDGLTGCINLSECSKYVNQASCQIDSIGKQIENDKIISTGACTWSESGQCINQTCKDLNSTSHEQCTLQLSSCTFDGTTCISRQNCDEYKIKDICSIAYGLQGKCIWNDAQGYCQSFMCSSIMNGNTLQQCSSSFSSCITDGTQCVNKDVCTSYRTKIACNIGGTDGICVWNGYLCSLMQSCTEANQDQEACLQAKDRCAFKYATGISSSSCYDHTCESYQRSNENCNSFYDWNQSYKRSCSIIDGKCSEMDLSILDESKCLSLSEYTYTWNASKSKCQSCNVQNDTKINETNNQTNSSTNSSANTSTPTSTVDKFSSNLQMVLILLIMIQ